MEFSTRQRLFNACDPGEALEPEDTRRVDLDGVREPLTWEASAPPSTQIVTAVPGSGLSTELLGLAGRLRDPGGANLVVAYAEVERALDPARPLDVADVLLLVASAAREAVARAGGALLPGAEARDDLAASCHEARRLGRSGVLVIVDGLEKLGGSLRRRSGVLASAERFFRAGAEHLELPVHTIYTAPPALLLRPHLAAGMRVLPALRVLGRDGRPDEAGFAAARSLVRARVPDDALAELLGAANVEDRVRRMIEESAGLPRDLVKLLQRVVAHGASDERVFDALLGEVGEARSRLLFGRSYPELARVHAGRSLPPEDRPADDDLGIALDAGAVLPYRDARGTWFDVVPAVRELRGVAEEIERVRARMW